MGGRRGAEEQRTVLHCRRDKDIDDNQGRAKNKQQQIT